jgi:predicted dehydrogenase
MLGFLHFRPCIFTQKESALMNKNTIRSGIIGSGFAARFHYEGIKRVYGAQVNIIGAFSPNRERLESFTMPRGITAITDIEALIDITDVLHVCTPPSTHEELVVKCLEKGKYVIVEKPFTGYFGDGNPAFNGDDFPREDGLNATMKSIKRMLDAERKSTGSILYAENWIYAPAIQKAKEMVVKTGGQILWIQGQQSHSGSHSTDYGKWCRSGGGSLMGKGCHPLSAAIFLKQAEGLARNGKPILPVSVSAHTMAITRMPGYINEGHLRDTYTDVEDYGTMHVVFDDGTIADITACELLHGGVKNYLEVHANNHRTICNMGPNNAMLAYNPAEENFKDIYVVEKTGTKQGWSFISPDEAWFNGYQHEMEAFYRHIGFGDPVDSNSMIAAATIATIYAAYVSAEKAGTVVKVPSLLSA